MTRDTVSYMQINRPGSFVCNHPTVWQLVIGNVVVGCRMCGAKLSGEK